MPAVEVAKAMHSMSCARHASADGDRRKRKRAGKDGEELQRLRLAAEDL